MSLRKDMNFEILSEARSAEIKGNKLFLNFGSVSPAFSSQYFVREKVNESGEYYLKKY